MTYKINLYSSILILFLYVFKNILVYLGIDGIIYSLTAVVLFLNFILLCANPKIVRRGLLPLVFILFGVIPFFNTMKVESAFVAGIGYANTYVHILYWSLLFFVLKDEMRFRLFKSFVHANLAFAVLSAGFAVYQYFVDTSLFGTTPDRAYSHIDPAVFTPFTQRATAFIGSPQNFGIYLAISAATLFWINVKPWLKISFVTIIVAAAFLAASKAFFAFFIAFFVGRILFLDNQKRAVSFIVCLLLGLLLLAGAVFGEQAGQYILDGFADLSENQLTFLDTVISAFKFAARLSSGLGHEYNFEGFIRFRGPFELFYGNGLGLTDRVVEVIMGRDAVENWVLGSESYILKILYEIGLIGLAIFCSLFFMAFRQTRKAAGNSFPCYFPVLCGVMANLLVTPSFTGLTMSFVMWPFILFPVLCNMKMAEDQIAHAEVLGGRTYVV